MLLIYINLTIYDLHMSRFYLSIVLSVFKNVLLTLAINICNIYTYTCNFLMSSHQNRAVKCRPGSIENGYITKTIWDKLNNLS